MSGWEDACDQCVPRGCSCNDELKDGIDLHSPEAQDPKSYYQELDEQGRKYPCCEWSNIEWDERK